MGDNLKLGLTTITLVDSNGNIVQTFNLNKEEDENMEEKLNKYLEENNIEVNDNGDFEMFVVVDADDKDHEVGSIFHGEETEVYAEKGAYDDLKENGNMIFLSNSFVDFSMITSLNLLVEKKKSIKEELLTMEDKMFKVLVNKENVVNVKNDVVYVNKYKVIGSIELNPVLKFKIKSIDNDKVSVLIYNNITEKSKATDIEHWSTINTTSIEDVKRLVKTYLEEDEKQVNMINSIVDDGLAL
jgi:hypothetical protein